MGKTFHAQRAERQTGRADRTAKLRAAETIAQSLENLATRRAEQHAAEMARHSQRNGVHLSADCPYRIPGYALATFHFAESCGLAGSTDFSHRGHYYGDGHGLFDGAETVR